MDQISEHRPEVQPVAQADGPHPMSATILAALSHTPAALGLRQASERLNAMPRVAALQRMAARVQPSGAGDGVVQAKWARQPDTEQVFVDADTMQTYNAATRMLTIGGASSQEARTLDEAEAEALLIRILAAIHAEEAMVEPDARARDNANGSIRSVANDDGGQVEQPAPALMSPKTIQDFLETRKARIDDYMAPDVVKPPKGKTPKVKQGEVNAFNAKLAKLAGMDIAVGPFVVTIVVGDLQGSGDVMAGAKLAKELQALYAAYEPWRNVAVYLDLLKDVDEATLNQVRKVAGAAVGIGDGDSASHEGERVTVSYPAHNAPGDFKVQQYGYQRLGDAHAGYGSGPGFGSLGVLSPDRETIETAVAQANDPSTSPNLSAILGLLGGYGVEETSFAYFSKYSAPVKEFAKKAAANSDKQTIGIVISRSAAPIEQVATGLLSVDNIVLVEVVEIDTSEKAPKVGATKSLLRPVGKKKGAAVPDPAGGRKIVLVNLPHGIQNSEVMSMYHASDGLVGATGDQSFMEAYRMRSLKKDPGKILYDVQEQQIPLMTHIGELESGFYSSGDAQRGLKEVAVNPKVMSAIDSKPLVVPMVLLINEQVTEKRSERD